MEGRDLRVSQQVLEWQKEARIEAELKTLRSSLLHLLQKYCKAAVPVDLEEAIQATQDMDLLLRWFDAAIEVKTFDEFRAAMKS